MEFHPLEVLIAPAVAFVLAVALIPLLSRPASVIGLIDTPCVRKRHDKPVPLIGGLAIFLAFGASLMLVPYLPPAYGSLIFGMSLLLILGLVDDIRELSAWFRLAVQVLVATVMVVWGGVEIRALGNLVGFGEFGLGPFAVPFTVLCTVFMINAINMADGLDGLAGGMVFIILSMLALLGWLAGKDPGLISVAALLAMATLGFLIYNARSPFRRRASVFMGDAGSMMLGFAIAWLAISMAGNGTSRVQPVFLAWILLIPAMDTFAISVRRLSRGRSPLAADRTHMHHIIIRCGYPVRTAVRVLHLAVLATALFAILAWTLGWPQAILFWMAAALFIGHTAFLLTAHLSLRWVRRWRRSA